MKLLLTLAATFLCCVSTTFAQFTGTVSDSQGVKYTANDDESTCYVSGHEDNYSTTIYIPEVFEGRSVTSIGFLAISGCGDLTSITIPNSVTTIGEGAFMECSGLTAITIPNSVTSIGSLAFSGCSGLTTINVDQDNSTYDSRNNCNAIIETASNTLIVGFHNTVIPNSVTSIGDGAFFRCNGLTTITIPNSVKSIGTAAFMYCRSLTSITIPNSVTSIGSEVFSCSGLISATIGNGVTSIGREAFCRCIGLTSVTIGNSVTSIGLYAFARCSGLTSVTIPNSVTSIGGGAFGGCSGLTAINVESDNNIYDSRNNCNAIIETASNTLITGCQNTEIPNSVTSIGERAFELCSGLTSITIPNSVTSIGERAFSETAWYDNQPDGLVYAGKVAYKYKGTMPDNTKIVLEEGTISITDYAFSRCSGLTSITIPNSVTSIGGGAFEGCSGLTSISIPNSVTNIGDDIFSGCSSLTSISIPNSITNISARAFFRCNGLTSITIPNSVTSIYNWAFADCSGLTSVTVDWDTPLKHIYDVFEGSNYLNATLYVPKGTKALYEAADVWKDFGKIVETDKISIGEDCMGTYCSTNALDFSGTDDIKAYIVSVLKPSTGEVTLTRITDVPANTGIVVKGAAGTYTIPMGPGETIVSNMLRGVTTNTVLNKVEGDYTNYVLAKKNGNLGFYAVVDGSTLSAGKAYLPLPTASLPSGARSIKLVFEDGGTTGISEASPLNDNGEIHNDNVYDLQGCRVEKPTRGLYIVNGRKVVIK